MIPVALVPLLLGGGAAPAAAAPTVAPVAFCDVDRREHAVAFGLLLDNPPPTAVIDEAVAVADRLRGVYGIDTGDRLADREEAARRAAALLDGLVFGAEEIAKVAGELGFDLEPAACGSSCRDIRALAQTELRRRALLRMIGAVEPPTDRPATTPCLPPAPAPAARAPLPSAHLSGAVHRAPRER